MPDAGPSAVAAPPMRTLVVLGHPRGPDSFCGALAEAYADGARAAGGEVRALDLASAPFEPHVHTAKPQQQTLEPILERLRRGIEWADHLVFVYPNWWGTMPALLKGALDRVLLPGWAFHEIPGGIGFEGRLGPRTAELLTTLDTPNWAYRLIYGAPGHKAMARATLGFCGIETVAATGFSGVSESSDRRRAAWLGQARALGARRMQRRRPWAHALARGAGTWLRALRLQFYPMTFVAYTVGALAAARLGGHAPGGAAFWLGYAVLFWLEAATVFINDVFDAESDRRNDRYGPFTGGSRVLVEGRLSARALGRGAVASLLLAALCLALLFAAATPPPVGSLAAIGLLAAFALGYTLPPVKLSHRGLGELDVALTHSLGVLYVGYVLHAGPPGNPEPLWLALPIFFAVLAAITLSGIPDRDADAAAGKRTLVVKLGVRRAGWLAAGSAALAVALAAGLHRALEVQALAGLDLIAGLHLVWLLWLLRPLLAGRADGARRIDGPMAASLLFIAWFGLIPLVNLL